MVLKVPAPRKGQGKGQLQREREDLLEERAKERFQRFVSNVLRQLKTLYKAFEKGISRRQFLSFAGGRERNILESLIRYLLGNGVIEEFYRHGTALYYRLKNKIPNTVPLEAIY